jgi:hypothetical protein
VALGAALLRKATPERRRTILLIMAVATPAGHPAIHELPRIRLLETVRKGVGATLGSRFLPT